MQTMLILTAKDEGSMHRKAYLDEVKYPKRETPETLERRQQKG